MKATLARFGFLALLIGTIAGCDGGGGGAVAPAPAPGPAPGTLPPAPIPAGNLKIDVATLTAEQLAALDPQIVFGGAVVNSAPQVSFAVQDPNGNPITGFKAATTGLRFTIAKLVPGAPVPGSTTATTPSKWVSYVVISSSGAAQRPNYETNGTLVDNGNGTYAYTFGTDIATVKATVDGLAFGGDATPPTDENRKADLGDLTYDKNLTHRIVIQLSGGIDNPANGIYDFVPATGAKVAATETDPAKQRNVVSINNCNECHGKLTLHGARINTQYCVVCHTDQRRYGRANVTSTNLAFPALVEKAVVDSTTGFTRYLYSKNTDTASSSYHPTGTDPTYVGDGEAMGDFPRLIHKIHNGADLVKQNYNYANLPFNLKHFSMLDEGQRMCAKCHKDSTDAKQTANWQTTPSRIACGACHDGINFDTGAGTTLGGATTGHVGGAQPNTRCALCHDASNIPVYHRTENITVHNPTIAPGLVTFAYDIKSATVDSSNNVIVVFKITKDGTPLATLTPDFTAFTGSPSFLLAWAMPQNGIALPADFNNLNAATPVTFAPNIKGDATSIGLVKSSATSTSYNLLDDNRITGPDATGYFTATIPAARGFPVGATMRTVALQSYYTQVWGGPSTADDIGRHAISVVKTVTGDTPRGLVIDPAKCGNCHEWLELHGGSRVIGKDTQGLYVCVMCHNPAKATSGRGIADAAVNDYVSVGSGFSAGDLKILTEWGVTPLTFPVATGDTWALQLPVTSNNFKDMVHGIHKGRERVAPFRDARDRLGSGCGDNNAATSCGGGFTLLDFKRLDFPGIISKCETCHRADTYNVVRPGALPSTYESVNPAGMTTTVLAKAALSQPNATDTVTSPFAAACVSCHDADVYKSHMQISGGGQLMVQRSAFVAPQEQCAFCHGPGKIVDVAVAHK